MAGAFTLGVGGVLVWIVYAFFAPTIIARNYTKQGWKELTQ